jgi:microcystin-dependent protein
MADYVSNVTNGSTFDALMTKLNNMFDLIYPIGSVYMSFNATSPANLFGGTWTRLSNVFLYATSTDANIGNTGGESAHTLTISEMPSHSHTLPNGTGVAGSDYVANLTGGQVRHDSGITTFAYGGGQAHNNMPPYVQCAMWKRIA